MFRLLLPAGLATLLMACSGDGGNTESIDTEAGVVDASESESPLNDAVQTSDTSSGAPSETSTTDNGEPPVTETEMPGSEAAEPVSLEEPAISGEPSTPAAELSTPVAEPSTPVAEPSTPVAEPSTPVAEPTNPVAEPSIPVAEPSIPVAEPSIPLPVAELAGAASWSMEGNTIRFLNSDYFQVQSENIDNTTIETVCDGEPVCVVEDGSYQIVNQTSGELWQYVRVGLNSVFWSQSRINEASIRWRHIVYNFATPVRFDVYMQGQIIDSVAEDIDIREVLVNDFPRGALINLAVFAVFADGGQELVGENEVRSDGPSMDIISYGRPSEDRDTFGFEIWDLLPFQSQQRFPSDCLFAIPEGGYCFSPSTRYLIGYNEIALEPEPDWEFPLPGDNATNHIEALVHYHGSDIRNFAAKEMALVTDVTTAFADSRYELSVFFNKGTFQGTYPILADVRFSSDVGARREINLNGQDLRVEIGPERDRDDATIPAFARPLPRRLHIAGEYYEPNGLADTGDLAGWRQEGAFFAEIDPQVGETLSLTFYPGLTQAEVPLR